MRTITIGGYPDRDGEVSMSGGASSTPHPFAIRAVTRGQCGSARVKWLLSRSGGWATRGHSFLSVRALLIEPAGASSSIGESNASTVDILPAQHKSENTQVSHGNCSGMGPSGFDVGVRFSRVALSAATGSDDGWC